MATPLPSNTIYVFLTSPPSSVVPFPERLDDWLKNVITHEYAHILQLDMATGGLPATIRAIFGRYPLPFGIFNSTFPNMLQPLWLIEGLAVSEETLSGTSDRANSAYTEMLLRMAILENQFPTIDQAAGNRVSWPGGEIPYLFGARFIDYLRQKFGDEAVKKISQNYSNDFFPLRVDNNAEQTLGVSYVTLWDQWKTTLTEKYAAQRTALEQMGITTTKPLMSYGDENFGAQMGLNGDILYTSNNPYEYPALRLLSLDGTDSFLTRRNLGLTASWSPDQLQIAFSQLENFKNYSLYSDLYLYDLKSKEVKRLTKGARLRDPDFHPGGASATDGTKLIAVQGELGKDRLVIFHLNTGQYEPIEWIDGLLMSHPKWSPDG
jgi:Tol biopolymer transport system component